MAGVGMDWPRPNYRGGGTMRVKTIFFFASGNTAVCGSDGEQIPELQAAWLLTAIENMRSRGGEIDDETKICLPGGGQARLFKTDSGWNWRVI
jgi:hypothetical protein